jgi:hypothetical protein
MSSGLALASIDLFPTPEQSPMHLRFSLDQAWLEKSNVITHIAKAFL